ncbi:MAG: Trx7/PDZ domain-containing (seleno)protein [Candidatus Poribacteria bacterium]|nr:Trx7/PDZ domain-containing (seleno)protein [Candidatus Poribacteria bacterium]
MRKYALMGAALLMVVWVAIAQKPSPMDVQTALNDLEVGENWIYNDLDKGVAMAKETGKPLFVLIRCVPCLSCRAFDQEVMQSDVDLDRLFGEYVPVRIVRMNELDLTKFQFDYDLSWAGFMMNADGTIYGRYGTKSGPGDDKHENHISISGLKNALERGLKAHAGYPNNAALFNGKQGEKPRFANVREIAAYWDNLEKATVNTERIGVKRAIQDGDIRKGCVHCHMVKDSNILIAHQENTWTNDRVYTDIAWPLPENVGVTMDVDKNTVVKVVDPNSAAAKAGLKAGDELVTLNGQALLSIADIQWALFPLPGDGTNVKVQYKRMGNEMSATLALSDGWRKTDFGWRESAHQLRPQLGIWAPQIEDAEKLAKLGVAPGKMAGEVRWVPNQGAQRAGLRNGDVIVSVDGIDDGRIDWRFTQILPIKYDLDDTIELVILRDGARQTLTIPLQTN